MVHGAFCGGWVFDRFRRPFERAGHAVAAPDLPGRGASASPAGVMGLSMRDFARAVGEVCAAQPRPPILIGHSMGGLVAQLAAASTPIESLILLAPSPPWGVAGSTMEEALTALSLHALGPYWSLPVSPDYLSAKRWLFDRLTAAQGSAAFSRMVPESGRALWETLNWWLDPFAATAISPGRISAPALAIAGGRDTLQPPATVALTAARLGGEVRIFPQMSHWLPGEPGWSAVAQTCLTWIEGAARLNAA
jgi:pimeloyl-ACP methyl ester carboxylesterase